MLHIHQPVIIMLTVTAETLSDNTLSSSSPPCLFHDGLILTGQHNIRRYMNTNGYLFVKFVPLKKPTKQYLQHAYAYLIVLVITIKAFKSTMYDPLMQLK